MRHLFTLWWHLKLCEGCLLWLCLFVPNGCYLWKQGDEWSPVMIIHLRPRSDSASPKTRHARTERWMMEKKQNAGGRTHDLNPQCKSSAGVLVPRWTEARKHRDGFVCAYKTVQPVRSFQRLTALWVSTTTLDMKMLDVRRAYLAGRTENRLEIRTIFIIILRFS